MVSKTSKQIKLKYKLLHVELARKKKSMPKLFKILFSEFQFEFCDHKLFIWKTKSLFKTIKYGSHFNLLTTNRTFNPCRFLNYSLHGSSKSAFFFF